MLLQERREEQGNQSEANLNKPQEMLSLLLSASRLDEPHKFIAGDQDEARKDEQDNSVTEFFQRFTHGSSAFFHLFSAYIIYSHFSRLQRDSQLVRPLYAAKKGYRYGILFCGDPK